MTKKKSQHAKENVFPKEDLVVLVADKDAEETIKGILSRPQSIGMRPVKFRCIRHPQHDPGCVHRASQFLKPCRDLFQYALVILDHEGSGKENSSREKLEKEIVRSLDGAYWHSGCIEAIAIAPELEAWVWSRSREVPTILGWDKTRQKQSIKAWITQNKPDYWDLDAQKPTRPKETMEEVLYQARVPWSSSLFKKLAETVSLKRCEDPAYNKLIDTLQQWFPPDS